MSKDEEATMIGRMVLERKELTQRATVLGEAIRDFAVRIRGIGNRLDHAGGSYQEEPLVALTGEEVRTMSEHDKVNALLAENAEVSRRLKELNKKLTEINL